MLDGLSAAHLRQAVVVFLGHGQLDPVDAPNLRWVQFSSAGIGGLIGTALASSLVPVASACGAYSTTGAEMVLGLLLSFHTKTAGLLGISKTPYLAERR